MMLCWRNRSLMASLVSCLLLGCAAEPSLIPDPADPSDVRRHQTVGLIPDERNGKALQAEAAVAVHVAASVTNTSVTNTSVSNPAVDASTTRETALPPGVCRVRTAAGDTRLDGAGLVQEMLTRWSRVKDYTAELEKQEFLHGRVEPAHKIVERTRVTPKALHYTWVGEVNRGRQALWVTGKFLEKIGVHPHPFLPLGTLWLDPGGFMARTQSQYDFRDGGMQGIIATLPKSLRPGATIWTYTGTGSVGGRPTWILMGADDTDVPGEHNQMELHIDQIELVPLFFCGRNREGRLNIRVVYRNVKLNVGLTDDDFDPGKLWQ